MSTKHDQHVACGSHPHILACLLDCHVGKALEPREKFSKYVIVGNTAVQMVMTVIMIMKTTVSGKMLAAVSVGKTCHICPYLHDHTHGDVYLQSNCFMCVACMLKIHIYLYLYLWCILANMSSFRFDSQCIGYMLPGLSQLLYMQTWPRNNASKDAQMTQTKQFQLLQSRGHLRQLGLCYTCRVYDTILHQTLAGASITCSLSRLLDFTPTCS